MSFDLNLSVQVTLDQATLYNNYTELSSWVAPTSEEPVIESLIIRPNITYQSTGVSYEVDGVERSAGIEAVLPFVEVVDYYFVKVGRARQRSTNRAQYQTWINPIRLKLRTNDYLIMWIRNMEALEINPLISLKLSQWGALKLRATNNTGTWLVILCSPPSGELVHYEELVSDHPAYIWYNHQTNLVWVNIDTLSELINDADVGSNEEVLEFLNNLLQDFLDNADTAAESLTELIPVLEGEDPITEELSAELSALIKVFSQYGQQLSISVLVEMARQAASQTDSLETTRNRAATRINILLIHYQLVKTEIESKLLS